MSVISRRAPSNKQFLMNCYARFSLYSLKLSFTTFWYDSKHTLLEINMAGEK